MALIPPAPDHSRADPYRDGFEEARRDLLMADSPDERATAARKLGSLGNPAAVAYLIAALYDNTAEVRNAAAESLGLIGDAAALGPLTDLQEREGTESDTVIANAIRVISSRQKDFDASITSMPGDLASSNESTEFELDLDSRRAETGNATLERHTETKIGKNILNEAVAEIDVILKAQSEQAARNKNARDKDSASNPVFEVEPQREAPETNTRTTISDEIDAGFELLRQAEARQSQLIAAAEDRLREQQEARHQIECSIRQRAEEEKGLAEEIEALQLCEQEVVKRIREGEERRRVQYEAVRRAEIEMRARAEEERLRLAELAAKRHHAEEETRKRSEQEQQLQVGIDLLAQALTEQNDRIAAAEAKMVETLRTLKADEERHAAEALAALKLHEKMREQAAADLQQRSEQAQRLTAEIESLQKVAEEQAKRISECEAEVVRAQAAALAQSEAEARLLEKVEQLQQAEAEARRLAAAEANERVAANLRSQAEAEERRLVELAEIKNKAEVEAQQRAKREAELTRQLESLAQAEQEQTNRLQIAEKYLQTKKEMLGQIESQLERLTEEDTQRSSRVASLQATLQQVQAESQQLAKEEALRIEELAELRRKTEAELSKKKELAQQLSGELEMLRATSQSQLKAVTELETKVQQARGERQELKRREANLNQQLQSLGREEKELRERLQATETSMQRQQETCKQVELECQQRAAAAEVLLNELAATREQAAEEGRRRVAQEAKLNEELEALRATGENQLKAISELEASVQLTQGEVQQRSTRQAELEQQLSSLTKEEKELRERLQAADTSLQRQQETCKQVELECQQRTEAEERQIATLAATREQLAEEGRQRAVLEQQLSSELAALRAAEANQLTVIKKLEANVWQARIEAEQLISREAQLNGEIQTLQPKLASQLERQTAAAARRAEQENSLREMNDAARLLTDQEALRTAQLQALRHQFESQSQQRLADERQLILDIEALRLEETEHRARLEELREHAASLEGAKRLQTLEESNISAEIAALEASIFRAEEPRATELLELTAEREAEPPEAMLSQPSEQAELELFVPVEAAVEPEKSASEVVSEIAVFEVIDDEEATDAEPLILPSDSFSFEPNSPAAIHEEEIVIGNTDLEMPAVKAEQVKLTDLEPVTATDEVDDEDKSLSLVTGETGLTQANLDSPLSQAAKRLESSDPAERCEALMDISKLGGEEAFELIANRFDDPSVQVRNAAARAVCELHADRAASLTRALREAQPERRRRIGAAFAGSGLASQAINCLAGESREVTYDAFTILFLMAKAGEVQPLIDTIESHANIAVRLAVIKLLAFSNQADVVAAFRRLAVRASIPAEVRSAVMEAIHDITSPARQSKISAA